MRVVLNHRPKDPPASFLCNKNTNKAELLNENSQSQGSVPNVSSHRGQGHVTPLCGLVEVTQPLAHRSGGEVPLKDSPIKENSKEIKPTF